MGATASNGAKEIAVYRVTQFAIKPGTLEGLNEYIASSSAAKKLKRVPNLKDVQIVVSADGPMLIKATLTFPLNSNVDIVKRAVESQGKSVDEVFEGLWKTCPEKPTHLIAKGGKVELGGRQLWSLTASGIVQHQTYRLPVQGFSKSRLVQMMNDESIRKTIAGIVGLLDVEIVLQFPGDRAKQQLGFHFSFISEAHLNQAQGALPMAVKRLFPEAAAEPQKGFRAVGGRVNLGGVKLWSLSGGLAVQQQQQSMLACFGNICGAGESKQYQRGMVSKTTSSTTPKNGGATGAPIKPSSLGA